MTQEEMKAVLAEELKNLPKGVTKEELAQAIDERLKSIQPEVTKEQYNELKQALELQGAELAKKQTAPETVKSLEQAILDLFAEKGITNGAQLKAHKDFKDGIEFKAEVPTLTTAQTGTIGRTDMVTRPVFPLVRQLAFLPYMNVMPLSEGKSIIGWTTGAYTSNVGYVGENATIGTNDAATAVEKTRGLAKIQAIKIITQELESDLPELARQMAFKMQQEFLLAIDNYIYNGDGNPDTNANPTHFYGLKLHATAFDATDFAGTVAKANLADLIGAIKTKAKKQFRTISHVWMNPTDVYKYSRIKDTEGQYIIGTLITGQKVIEGVEIIETEAITAGTLFAADASVFQLRVKKEINLRIGEFGDDAKYERKSALMSYRAQVLVEDEDRKSVYYVANIQADIDEIDPAV